MYYGEHLELKVQAVNLAHAMINKFEGEAKEFFRKFVGTKILLANGSLRKSIKDALPTALCLYHDRLHFYMNDARYNFGYYAKTCVSGSDSCVYHEQFMLIGSLKDGVLMSIDESPSNLKEDYTVDEVLKNRKEVSEAEAVLRGLKNKFCVFE